MVDSQETFESLTGRHLDGELSADQQAQFYRLIMRDPAKRGQAEQARRLDQAASKALHAVLDAPLRPVRISALPRQRSSRRWLLLQLLATAALLMLTAGVWQLLAIEKQSDAAAQVNRLAAAGVAVQSPKSPEPKLEVPAAYATTDEASLALSPPKLPDVTAVSALSASPMGEMWWRKHATVAVATPARSAGVTLSAAPKAEKTHHYWSVLLEAIDPTGKRFEMFKQSGGVQTQPVVNSVSGEL